MPFYRNLTMALILSLLITAFSPLESQEKRGVEGLIFDLKHPETDRRKAAAQALGNHRIRRAVPGLIPLATDSDSLVRLETVRALVKINDARALQALITLTHDSRKETQRQAIQGLVNIYVNSPAGFIQEVKNVVDLINPVNDDYNPLVVESYIPVSDQAVDALADLLTFSDIGIRKNAVIALGILRGHRALPAIQEILEQEIEDGVKVEMIRTIYKIGDATAGPSLIPLIRDSDKKVHDEAIFALGRLGVEEAVPYLLEIYSSGVEERKKILGLVPVSGKDDLQRKTLEALAHIGDSRSQKILISALEDERTTYRRYGAEGLGRIRDLSLVTRIAQKHLREKSEEVKLALSFALFRMGRDEHLLDLVDGIGKDQAYFYLLELDPGEVNKLHSHLRGQKPSIQARLLDVIGQRGDLSSLSIVEPMIQSESSTVASSANLALRRLRGQNSEKF